MSVRDSLRQSCGYVLTDKGRQDLVSAERCLCEIHIRGGKVECKHCQTVYGLVSQMFAAQLGGGTARKPA